MLKKLFILWLCLIVAFQAVAQINANRKKLTPSRTTTAIKIDGQLEEVAWENAVIAKDFIMYTPTNGEPEPDSYATEVRVLYDDNALYIGAIMKDPEPAEIPQVFTTRDQLGIADHFCVTINPNDDGQNAFKFVCEITGNQYDAKISSQAKEDSDWSAVWASATQLTDEGWVAELMIPYNALRFANEPMQEWGINFLRKRINTAAQYTWNFIDNEKGDWTQYDGLLTDIENLQPPVRLELYPYAYGAVNFHKDKTHYDKNVGMDVKYGITENFTLDATLIPDFNQTGFDKIELNLGPFEQRYEEQRPFFTEGTELFTKGGLFYSRRVGDLPSRYYQISSLLEEEEKLKENPQKVNMLNAIKLSGRTKKGLGVGLFNAITEKTMAEVYHAKTQKTRKIVTEPLANYNILVVDQQFNQNSSVTFINTNVLRKGSFRDANVSGLLYHLKTKDNKFFVEGSAKASILSENSEKTNGYSFDAAVGKSSGNWQGKLGYQYQDSNYDINDLGMLNRNNRQLITTDVSYRILKPTRDFTTINFTFNGVAEFLQKSGDYTGNSLKLSAFFITERRFGFGGFLHSCVGKQYDYYEPRQGSTSGVFFVEQPHISSNFWISTDYRKRLALDLTFSGAKYFNQDKYNYGIKIQPLYRFSDCFTMRYMFRYVNVQNNQGFVRNLDDGVLFGERDQILYSNSLSGRYNFSIESSLGLAFRHNWQKAVYDKQYYTLNSDGLLDAYAYEGNHNINFNVWNLDLNYLWQFAPGSQLVFLYRNSIIDQNAQTELNFANNLNELFDKSMQHTFSLKFIYYIDAGKFL